MKRIDELKVITDELEIEEERYQQIEKNNMDLKIKMNEYNEYLEMYNHVAKLEEEVKEFNQKYIEDKIKKESRLNK